MDQVWSLAAGAVLKASHWAPAVPVACWKMTVRVMACSALVLLVVAAALPAAAVAAQAEAVVMALVPAVVAGHVVEAHNQAPTRRMQDSCAISLPQRLPMQAFPLAAPRTWARQGHHAGFPLEDPVALTVAPTAAAALAKMALVEMTVLEVTAYVGP